MTHGVSFWLSEKYCERKRHGEAVLYTKDDLVTVHKRTCSVSSAGIRISNECQCFLGLSLSTKPPDV